jgi:hypothetical protein
MNVPEIRLPVEVPVPRNSEDTVAVLVDPYRAADHTGRAVAERDASARKPTPGAKAHSSIDPIVMIPPCGRLRVKWWRRRPRSTSPELYQPSAAGGLRDGAAMGRKATAATRIMMSASSACWSPAYRLRCRFYAMVARSDLLNRLAGRAKFSSPADRHAGQWSACFRPVRRLTAAWNRRRYQCEKPLGVAKPSSDDTSASERRRFVAGQKVLG